MAPRPQSSSQLQSSTSHTTNSRSSSSSSLCSPSLHSLLSPLALVMDPLPTLSELRHSPVSSIPSDGNCWRWTIPAIVEDNGDDGLAEVAVETLTRCLRPVLDGLAALDAEILLELERCDARGGTGAALHDGVQVKPIHNAIDPPTKDQRAVRYLHLSELEGQYSMGIFVFPPHARIPLHDHPGMCVLSRVLYGDVHRLQLDLARDDMGGCGGPEHPLRSTGPLDQENTHQRAGRKRSIDHYQTLDSHGHLKPPTPSGDCHQSQSATAAGLPASLAPPVPGAKRAYRRNVDHLQAPATTMLFPYEGNLHEFVAGPHGAALLDVLLPPYDVLHHRDCTFYEIWPPQDEDDAVFDEGGPDDGRIIVDREGARPSPCWIVPTGQPEDFHCISGRFLDIGSASSSAAASAV